MRFLSVKVNWKVLGTDLSWPFSGHLYASHEGPGFSHLRGSHHHSSQPWTSHCESATPSILTSSLLSLQRPSLNCISPHPLLLFYHFLVTNLRQDRSKGSVLRFSSYLFCMYRTSNYVENSSIVQNNSLLLEIRLPFRCQAVVNGT